MDDGADDAADPAAEGGDEPTSAIEADERAGAEAGEGDERDEPEAGEGDERDEPEPGGDAETAGSGTDPDADEGADHDAAPPEEDGDAGVRSDWWYVAAAVVVWGVVLTALVLYGQFVVPTGEVVRQLALVGLVPLLLLPAALYVDGGRVADAGGEWTPSRTLYAVGAIGGVAVPPLSVGVAGLYLLRRHRYVGVP